MIDNVSRTIQEPYIVNARVRLARSLLRPVFRLLFHILARVEITGKQNVPKSGAYLIAINHISIFEPPFALAFWPVAPEAVGAVEIWDRKGQSALAKLYGGIPVYRGQYNRQLLDTMITVLQSGMPLLIAPEGGRSHTPGLRMGLPGVAYVMDKARVPVLPVGIVGTTEDFFSRAMRVERPKLEMRIGQPLLLPAIEGKGAERRAALQRNVDQIMYQIASLLPVEYRGEYRG